MRNGAQVWRSSVLGLLSGGAHLTAQAMRVSFSSCPSLIEVLVGIFAAGSVEIAEERTERRRVQRHVRDKYGRTY